MIRISTRMVLLIGSIAIKIPLSRRGYIQCKNEKKMWEKYSSIGILAELRWEKAGIVCMRRYRQGLSIEQTEKAAINAKSAIPEFDIERCDLYVPQNWGFSEDGQPILIDYGISEQVSRMY